MHRIWSIIFAIVVLLTAPSVYSTTPTNTQQIPLSLKLQYPYLNPTRKQSQWRYLGYALAPFWVWVSAYPNALLFTWAEYGHGKHLKDLQPTRRNFCVGYWNFRPDDSDNHQPNRCSLQNSSSWFPWLVTTTMTSAAYPIVVGYLGGTNGNTHTSAIVSVLLHTTVSAIVFAAQQEEDNSTTPIFQWSYGLQFIPIAISSYVGAWILESTHQPTISQNEGTVFMPTLSVSDESFHVGISMQF